MRLMPSAPKTLFTALIVLVTVVAVVQWRASTREAHVEAVYPPSGQFVEVEGTRIHVHVEGEGPDLVLIHGASGSLRDFTFDMAKRLASNHRVITMDRPGLGWSERPEAYGGVWNMRAEPPRLQARILQAAADAVGVTNPVVVGHSFGGAVALAWALERPDRTAALVLLGAASNPWPGDLGLLYKINSTLLGSTLIIPAITAFTPRSVIEETVSSIFAPQKPPEGYMSHFGPEMSLRRAALRANAQQVNGLRPHIVEMAEEYRNLSLPVEILHGAADDTVPLKIHSEPLSRQLPNGVLTVLDDVGHMPQHAAPDAVIAAIDRAVVRAGLR